MEEDMGGRQAGLKVVIGRGGVIESTHSRISQNDFAPNPPTVVSWLQIDCSSFLLWWEALVHDLFVPGAGGVET